MRFRNFNGLAALALLYVVQLNAFESDSEAGRPQLLSMAELKALATASPPREALTKLDALLNTPFISNSEKAAPAKPAQSVSGLRVAFWNIERGLQLDLIRIALSDPAKFRTVMAAEKPISERRWRKAERELAEFRRADIIILNEVDYGMKRTHYADVARELADSARLNYAFGVEFVEVDPLYTGEQRIQMKTPELTEELANDLQVDPERYRGLHGNAILSRYPIRSATIRRLPECYDWYREEANGIAELERGKRWAADKIFAERVKRQVRRGGRMALIVELELPGLSERFTVVSVHLEDRATTACRMGQIKELATELRDVTGPLIIGGDLNTSGKDGTPTSIGYEIKKRVSDPRFWIRGGIRWFTPFAVPLYISWPFNFWKNFHDPTAVNIPLIGPNRARRLFRELRSFKFADGSGLDFTGDPTRSGNGRSRTLANSNERIWKGFHPSYHLERNYFGLVAYRLDWLFVKTPSKPGGVESFRPHNPKTLNHFNELGKDRLSDHHPITVELDQSGAAARPRP